MHLNLIKITLENFKGTKFIEINAEGNDLCIYGQNGAGKTSLPDAFMWGLFNKDSHNNAEFDIKERDASGEEISNLDHAVTILLDIGGALMELKKVYKEKWTKKRGSTSLVFEGHKTDYFIDGVPKTKTEYDRIVSSLMDEKLFKLLTNPAYFNTHLSWQERRNILIDIVGDCSMQDVIAANQQLKVLPEILGGRSVEDCKKVIAATKVKINEQLKEIPVRIAELSRNMPDREGLDLQTIFQETRLHEKQKEALQQKVNDIKNGSEIITVKNQLLQIDADLLELKNEHNAKKSEKLTAKQDELRKNAVALNALKNDYENNKSKFQSLEAENKEIEQKIAELKNEWYEVYRHELEFASDTVCPTCNRDYPQEYIESIKHNALKNFNIAKAEKLEEITQTGQGLSNKRQNNLQILTECQAALVLDKEKITTLTRTQQQLNEEIQDIINLPGYLDDPAYKNKESEKVGLADKLQKLSEQNNSGAEQYIEEISLIDQKLSVLREQTATIEQSLTMKKRIEELKETEKQLAVEYEAQMQHLEILEAYITTKTSLLTDKINEKFTFVDFKLIDRQVDGTPFECCEAVIKNKGARFGTGMSDGEKINAGLDIINVLSEHYGKTAPIWIDNSESVTRFIPIKAQCIKLYASENDKKLRIEYPEKINKEAV